jgi:hypothetical protein
MRKKDTVMYAGKQYSHKRLLIIYMCHHNYYILCILGLLSATGYSKEYRVSEADLVSEMLCSLE